MCLVISVFTSKKTSLLGTNKDFFVVCLQYLCLIFFLSLIPSTYPL